MSGLGYTQDLEAGAVQGGYELQQRDGFQNVLYNRRLIQDELQKIKENQQHLRPAQQAVLDSTNATEDYQTHSRMIAIDESISDSFNRIRGLIADLKATSDRDDPRVEEQINIISNTMNQPLQEYRTEQMQFSKKLRSQVQRRYEIAHPDATEEEVSVGVENVIQGEEQLFAVQGMRTQQANDARTAVQQRSATIRKIEQDMMAIAVLFQEVNELVQEHEFQVEKIQDNAASAEDNMRNANEKLSFAVRSAQSARKYKWWILLVCVLIIAIIVAICVAWCKVTNHC